MTLVRDKMNGRTAYAQKVTAHMFRPDHPLHIKGLRYTRCPRLKKRIVVAPQWYGSDYACIGDYIVKDWRGLWPCTRHNFHEWFEKVNV